MQLSSPIRRPAAALRVSAPAAVVALDEAAIAAGAAAAAGPPAKARLGYGRTAACATLAALVAIGLIFALLAAAGGPSAAFARIWRVAGAEGASSSHSLRTPSGLYLQPRGSEIPWYTDDFGGRRDRPD